jgi:hypothetical protein
MLLLINLKQNFIPCDLIFIYHTSMIYIISYDTIILSTSTRSIDTSVVNFTTFGVNKILLHIYENDSEQDVLSRFRALKCCDFL